MSTPTTIITQLNKLLSDVNQATGNSDSTLTEAIAALIEGFGASDCVGGIHIINKGLAPVAGSYTAVLSADDGHSVTTNCVSVTMDGVDITSTTYADNTITIDELTGDLDIVVIANATSSDTKPIKPTPEPV